MSREHTQLAQDLMRKIEHQRQAEIAAIPTPALVDELISRPDGRKAYSTRLAQLPRGTKILKPCPRCGTLYGVREMRTHVPKCGR